MRAPAAIRSRADLAEAAVEAFHRVVRQLAEREPITLESFALVGLLQLWGVLAGGSSLHDSARLALRELWDEEPFQPF